MFDCLGNTILLTTLFLGSTYLWSRLLDYITSDR